MSEAADTANALAAPRGFSRVPHCVLEGIMLADDLTSVQVRILLAVCRWQFGFNKTCADISLPELVRVTGAYRSRIQLALPALFEKGYLEIVRRPVRGRPRQVRIGARLLEDKALLVRPYPEEDNDSLGPAGQALKGPAGQALNGEIRPDQSCPTKKPSSKKADKESIVEFSPSASFDVFWKQLPKDFKKGKEKAWKWWHANIRDQAKADVLISAYQDQERERATCGAHGLWTPSRAHVTTWLHGKRWEDETLTDDEIRAKAAAQGKGNATGTGTTSGMAQRTDDEPLLL